VKITEKDIGKIVRLKNGTSHMITSFMEGYENPVRLGIGFYTRDGKASSHLGSEYDISEILDCPCASKTPEISEEICSLVLKLGTVYKMKNGLSCLLVYFSSSESYYQWRGLSIESNQCKILSFGHNGDYQRMGDESEQYDLVEEIKGLSHWTVFLNSVKDNN
jgi:hypothetical protein